MPVPEVERVKVVALPDGRLDARNAAQYLGLSIKTLAIMRSKGTGPRFVKLGRVFYFLEDLDAWIATQPRVKSSAHSRLSAPLARLLVGPASRASDRSRC